MEQLQEFVKSGRHIETAERVTLLLDEGNTFNDILSQGLIQAMDQVGELFERGEYYLPEMLLAARAMKAGLEILKPMMADSGVEPMGTVVIGTVQGDLHDIGWSHSHNSGPEWPYPRGTRRCHRRYAARVHLAPRNAARRRRLFRRQPRDLVRPR